LEGSVGHLLPKAALNLWPCLAGVGHPATCRCVEDCTVLTLATTDLLDLLGSDSELCLALLKYSALNQMISPAAA
jgi:CRP-like cAMP-binding protein